MMLHDKSYAGKLTKSETRDYYLNCVENDTKIIDSASNWNILLLKEALYIKRKSPIYCAFSQVQDMEQQLVRKAEGDDDIMLALNKKVAEWKVL